MESKKPGPPQNHQNLTHFLHDLAQPLATVTGLVDLLLLETDERGLPRTPPLGRANPTNHPSLSHPKL